MNDEVIGVLQDQVKTIKDEVDTQGLVIEENK